MTSPFPSGFTWRIQYDAARDEEERNHTDIVCEDESLTIQGAPDANINDIIARFGLNDGSVLPGADQGIVDPRYYGDFTDVPDLRTALDRIRDAQDAFNQLPAQVRGKFANDPMQLVDWIQDKNNLDEAEKLGLLTKKPEPPPAQP